MPTLQAHRPTQCLPSLPAPFLADPDPHGACSVLRGSLRQQVTSSGHQDPRPVLPLPELRSAAEALEPNGLNFASISGRKKTRNGRYKTTSQSSFRQGQGPHLSCRSWLKSGLGWPWLASWEVEAGVVRLRAGGSTAEVLLNWGVRLFPCIICGLLNGFGPWSSHCGEKGKP